MNIIPEKTTKFDVYKTDGTRFIGVADEVTLPKFEQKSEELSGAGISGSWDSPTPGAFGPLSMELTFRSLTSEAMAILAEDCYHFTLRAAQQAYQTAWGYVDQRLLKIAVKGRPKELDLGKLKQGAVTDTKVALSLVYIKVEEEGTVLLEYDVFNSIYVVNGVDKMAKLRSML